VAFRKALAFDRAQAAARSRLSELCAQATNEATDVETIATPSAASPATLMSAGLDHYRRGDWKRAHTLLAGAAAGEDPVTAAGAELFLGLIAHREGRTNDALAAFDRASSWPEHRPVALSMRRLAARSRRVALSLLLQPEYDTNPRLLPQHPPDPDSIDRPRPDTDLLMLGSLDVRLLPSLALRETTFWRRQNTERAFDLAGSITQLAWHGHRGSHEGEARYGFEPLWMAGAAYSRAHQISIAYQYLPTGRYAVGARYGLRRRDYLIDSAAPFTGFVQSGALEGSWDLNETGMAAVALAAEATRESTESSELTHRAAGGRLTLSWRATTVHMLAHTRALAAAYDAPNALGQRRRDLRAETGLDAQIDLHERIAVTAGFDAHFNRSTLAEFGYRKWVMRLGLIGYLGWP
jgi:hypothetical protein